MRRSIATVSLSGTLPEKLEAISAAHFDGVEIFENDLTFYAGTPRHIRTWPVIWGCRLISSSPSATSRA